ncbi:MAG: MFS transporter [Candidatus Obscuribacterales bacterium]|jgi:MFS family permease|nr:MFS transporter [Candidatus Obscuribacterales bacterium]
MLGGDLAKNFTLICSAKALRTLGFGLASVVLGLYLLERGFSKTEVGVLLSATLIQDAVLTTAFSALASKYNNRHILFLSCALMFFGALLIAFSQDKWILAIAVVCGIISPAGFEGGPFAAIEQSILSRAQRTEELTKVLSVYNMVGFGGAALGALLAGSLVAAFSSFSKLEAYQFVLVAYALCTPVILLLYGMLKIAPLESAEKMKEPDPRSMNSSSNDSNYRKSWIWQLAGLQSLDAFGGGFVVQSMLTLWFYQQYQLDAAFLGSLFFWCNIIAALSFTLAPWITRRIGLLRTMVFTHLPCSLTLCLLPFLPSKEWAAALLIARSFFSSMDIPVRQAYAMLLVPARDRAFASGLTSSSRAVAQSISPSLSGFLMQHFFLASPLICAGLAKSVYDILLYMSFRNIPLEGLGQHENSELSATSQTDPELLASTGNRT